MLKKGTYLDLQKYKQQQHRRRWRQRRRIARNRSYNHANRKLGIIGRDHLYGLGYPCLWCFDDSEQSCVACSWLAGSRRWRTSVHRYLVTAHRRKSVCRRDCLGGSSIAVGNWPRALDAHKGNEAGLRFDYSFAIGQLDQPRHLEVRELSIRLVRSPTELPSET